MLPGFQGFQFQAHGLRTAVSCWCPPCLFRRRRRGIPWLRRTGHASFWGGEHFEPWAKLVRRPAKVGFKMFQIDFLIITVRKEQPLVEWWYDIINIWIRNHRCEWIKMSNPLVRMDALMRKIVDQFWFIEVPILDLEKLLLATCRKNSVQVRQEEATSSQSLPVSSFRAWVIKNAPELGHWNWNGSVSWI